MADIEVWGDSEGHLGAASFRSGRLGAGDVVDLGPGWAAAVVLAGRAEARESGGAPRGLGRGEECAGEDLELVSLGGEARWCSVHAPGASSRVLRLGRRRIAFDLEPAALLVVHLVAGEAVLRVSGEEAALELEEGLTAGVLAGRRGCDWELRGTHEEAWVVLFEAPAEDWDAR